MASLKEVKNRIASIGSTKKITLARQMVASARLHQAQQALVQAMDYKDTITCLLQAQPDFPEKYELPCTQKNDDGPVAVIILSSNSGMCGAFNANMIRVLHHLQSYYPDEALLLFPIGKKIREAVQLTGFNTGFQDKENMDDLMEKASYRRAKEAATFFTELYLSGNVKQVDIIYYQYKNMAIQDIHEHTFLPFSLPQNTAILPEVGTRNNYIFEPSEKQLIEDLLARIIRADFYYRIAENQTSEHAARTMAMQLASENANEILGELRLMYNKLRQQNITTELLDIVGGSYT